VPVLSTALYQRFSSRGEADYQDKLLSAIRFGSADTSKKSRSEELMEVLKLCVILGVEAFNLSRSWPRRSKKHSAKAQHQS
jgi:hypothetical protein